MKSRKPITDRIKNTFITAELWKELEKHIQDKSFKKQFQKLSNKQLKDVVNNRSIALEYARKGIEKTDPENLTEEYINTMTDAIQMTAKMILEERTTKKY